MTKIDFERKNFDELISQLQEETDEVTTYEELKEFAINKIKSDDLFVAIHILEAINDDTAEYYLYDYCMGTLTSPSSIKEKDDIYHLIED